MIAQRGKQKKHCNHAGAWMLCLLAAWPAAGRAQATNTNPQPMTGKKSLLFEALACTGISPGDGRPYKTKCTDLPKYRGLGGGSPGSRPYLMSFSHILYGHFTDTAINQAYVTYSADFESHAANFGGGILFAKAAGGWTLTRWYPGGQLDDCVQLEPAGRAHLLCSLSGFGQGETAFSIDVVTLRLAPARDGTVFDEDDRIVKGTDESETNYPNANCYNLQPGQAILFGIDDLKASDVPGAAASAKLTYVEASAAMSFCARKDLTDAPKTTQIVQFFWAQNHITMVPALSFSATL